MAIKTTKSAFYHVPKTGGITEKFAIARSGLSYGRCRTTKGIHPFGLYREHSTPDNTADIDGLFSSAFVRHPVNWYRSFFAYRVKTNALDPKFPADRVWNDEINQFVNNVIDEYGNFVTQLYQFYIGEDCKKVNFIGKQESMYDDLVKALTLAGEQFDEKLLRGTPWRNIAASSKKYRDITILSDKTVQRIIDTERWIIDGFYV